MLFRHQRTVREISITNQFVSAKTTLSKKNCNFFLKNHAILFISNHLSLLTELKQLKKLCDFLKNHAIAACGLFSNSSFFALIFLASLFN